MSIAGIDIGTSGCKCTVYDKEGNLIKESYKEYRSKNTKDESTLDPLIVWNSVKNVVADATSHNLKIEAIGVTSFGEATVLLDEDDMPIGPSLLYTDPRGKEQLHKLVDTFGESYVSNITGLKPNEMYSVSKIMWQKENQPELFEKVQKIFLYQDFIVYMLSGKRQIDYSLASRTMLFDIVKKEWNKELLAVAGIEEGMLSKPVVIGAIAQCIKEELAIEFNISKNTKVVSGCHDQIAAAIGSGVYKQGKAVDGTGTVECMTPVFSKPISTEKLTENNYAIVPFINNLYTTYAFIKTGGSLLKWFRDRLAPLESKLAKEMNMNPYEYFNETIVDNGPSGLLVLPHFSGSGTPYIDGESKGAILGVTLDTDKKDLYKALMEGITYEMLLNIEKIEETGIYIDEIVATGGGANSDIWLQMKADIFNRPIVTIEASQSGTVGCVMLSGIACGLYASLDEAEKYFVKEKKKYYPRTSKHQEYSHYYQRYKKMYEATKNILS